MSTKATNRSLDETFDAFVCRPAGKMVAGWFVRETAVTANQVSGMAALCGMFAGMAYAAPWPFPAYGAVLMFTMMVLDCADGEVARLGRGGGWRGRILDGLADFVTAFSIHLGMLIHLARDGMTFYGWQLGPGTLFLLALAAGASMSWRCGAVDDIKQRLKSNSIDHKLEEYENDAVTLWDKFLWFMLTNYVRGIKRYTGKRRPGGYVAWRRAQLVGPTHHHLAMVIAGFLVQYSSTAFLWFFIISVIPANLYLLAVLWTAPTEDEPVASAEAAR